MSINHIKEIIEADRIYMDEHFPNRHKEIHKKCCERCPSNLNRINGIKDPETEDFKVLPKEIIAKEVLFVCAWRTEKLCKGICNEFGINQTYLNELYKS